MRRAGNWLNPNQRKVQTIASVFLGWEVEWANTKSALSLRSRIAWHEPPGLEAQPPWVILEP
jgi:hypothetical protein